MKVTITTLKAPWPKGAKVGDVVAFEGDTAPAWAVGKFAPAADDAGVDHEYVPVELVTNDAPALSAEVADLRAKLATAEEANDVLREKLAAKAPKK